MCIRDSVGAMALVLSQVGFPTSGVMVSVSMAVSVMVTLLFGFKPHGGGEFVSAADSKDRSIKVKGNNHTLLLIGFMFGAAFLALLSTYPRETVTAVVGSAVGVAGILSLMLRQLDERTYKESLKKSMAFVSAALLLLLPLVPEDLRLVILAVYLCFTSLNVIVLLNAVVETSRFDMISPVWLFGQEGSVFFLGIAPVSYTHLDVYKRQHQHDAVDAVVQQGDGADELAVDQPGQRFREVEAGAQGLVVVALVGKRDHAPHAVEQFRDLTPEARIVSHVRMGDQQDGQGPSCTLAVRRRKRGQQPFLLVRGGAVCARLRAQGFLVRMLRVARTHAEAGPQAQKCVLHAALFAHLVHQAGRNAHVAAAKRVRHQVGQCLEFRAEATSPPHVGQAGNEQGVAAPDQVVHVAQVLSLIHICTTAEAPRVR